VTGPGERGVGAGAPSGPDERGTRLGGRPTTVTVGASSGSYQVVVETGAIRRLPDFVGRTAPAHRYAVIADDQVGPLHGVDARDALEGAGMRAELFTFPAGEAHKTRESWADLTDAMLAAGYGRDAAVVAVGGGVTTDLAGFVAATYMRGIPVVQVPTSYLAMIDASVGGKTGVDVPAGKNLVGAFHPPRLVLADPEVLETLPASERAQGLVEAFKHGAILDADYFARLTDGAEALLAAHPDTAAEAIRRSIELKAAVVEQDEREGGLRLILNFGHTLGHALEAAADFGVGHGTAVAEGMLLEAEIGERLGVTAPGTRARLADGLGRLVLPELPSLDPDRVLGYLGVDKKARGGVPRYVLLRRLGEADPWDGWSRPVAPDLVEEVVRARLG